MNRLWFRWWARWQARRGDYFWHPCPWCGRHFGGQEWRRWGYPGIPDPTREIECEWPVRRIMFEVGICRICAVTLSVAVRHG